MRTTHILLLCVIAYASFLGISIEWHRPICGPEAVVDTMLMKALLISITAATARSKSNIYKTSFAVGQTFVGFTENVNRNTALGFYSRYFLPHLLH